MKMHDRFVLRHVMSMAHSIRRRAAERLNCRVSEVPLSECLRMAWEYLFTGCGEGMVNRIDSGKGYSTKSSAWRSARKLVGREIRDARVGKHPSVRYSDLGCTGNISDSWVEIDVLVREEMLSVYHASDGWHWSVEWWLEDIVLPIIGEPHPRYPDWINTRYVSLREFACWDGPRNADGIPCLNPRYAA